MLNIATVATRSSGWLTLLRTRVVRASTTYKRAHQEQEPRLHLAFHQTYKRFATAHPTWVARRVDADFLRQAISQHAMVEGTGRQAQLILPSSEALAWAWAHQSGALYPPAERINQVAALAPVLTHFLAQLRKEFLQSTL